MSQARGVTKNVVFVAIMIFALAVLALIIRGQVTLTPKRVVISTLGDPGIGKQKILQISTTNGNAAAAINAKGNVNIGTSSSTQPQPLHVDLNQQAIAVGNSARAINSGGDVNIK